MKLAVPLVGRPDAPEGQVSPQFRNDLGVREIRIGVKAFECVGETPPQDHPHVYLELGSLGRILCPYCNTLFCFDPGLGKCEVDHQTVFSEDLADPYVAAPTLHRQFAR